MYSYHSVNSLLQHLCTATTVTPHTCYTIIPCPIQQQKEQNENSGKTLIDGTPTSMHRERIHPNTSPTRCITVTILSNLLEHYCNNGIKQLPEDPNELTVFHTSCIPKISITDYFHRLARYTECSEEGLIQAVYHIYRAMQGCTGIRAFQLNSFNIHRLLLTSLLVTSKYVDDHYYNSNFYARIGGITVQEMNLLEIEWLSMINFELYIEPEYYYDFIRSIGHSHLFHQLSEFEIWTQQLEIQLPKQRVSPSNNNSTFSSFSPMSISPSTSTPISPCTTPHPPPPSHLAPSNPIYYDHLSSTTCPSYPYLHANSTQFDIAMKTHRMSYLHTSSSDVSPTAHTQTQIIY